MAASLFKVIVLSTTIVSTVLAVLNPRAYPRPYLKIGANPKLTFCSDAFIAPIPTQVERAENPCPKKNAAGQSIITTWDKSQYLCEDDTNYKAGDITGIIAYSLQDCADACATYSTMNGGCDSFTHDADVAKSYQINSGANCWLKNSRLSDGKNSDYNGSSAKLIRKT